MSPDDLRRELEARGLLILAVSRHRAHRDVMTVYLHGNAGRLAKGLAVDTAKKVPGVLAAAESITSPLILLIRISRPAGESYGTPEHATEGLSATT